MILGTIQKVGPLFVVCSGSSSFDVSLLLRFGVVRILVRGVLGYNQSYMRSLIAYSSISHTGWLVLGFVCRFSVFLIYLFIYFMLLAVLFSLFSFLRVNKVIFGGCGFKHWGFVSLLILRLSGVPPFSVFYLKVGVVYYIINYYAFIPFVLLGSVLSIYYYLTFIIPGLSVFWCAEEMRFGGVFGLLGLLVRFAFPLLFFL